MPDMADFGLHATEAFQPLAQPRSVSMSLDEYRVTSYSPDREFRDGFVLERNVGDKLHARLQARLAHYLGQRRKLWNIEVYTELRVQVTPDWTPLPDVCVYTLPDFEEAYPTKPPLLWIEIVSRTDTFQEVEEKTEKLLTAGVPNVWVVSPTSLTSVLHTSDAIQRVSNLLVVPGTHIEIVLSEVMAL